MEGIDLFVKILVYVKILSQWRHSVCFVSSILQLLMNLARMNTLTKGILDCKMSSSFVLSFTFKKAEKRSLQTKDKALEYKVGPNRLLFTWYTLSIRSFLRGQNGKL